MPHGWLPLIASASLIAGTGLLLFAALHDIVARTVPDWVSALLAVMGLGARIVDHTVLTGSGAALAIFVAGAILWRKGWLGGGDVKLIPAAALVVPTERIVPFLVAMSVSGSVLAVLYLIGGRIARRARDTKLPGIVKPSPLWARAVRAELWRLRRGGPLPYACAIAAGFLLVRF